MIEYTDKFIELVVKPGFTCLDIGANTGVFTEQMGKIVGESGKVIAVEPMPKWMDELQRKVPRAECHRVGICNKNEYHSKYSQWYAAEDPGNPGNGGLSHEPTEHPVPLKTLDEVMAGRKVDFIKIDVEGMEFEVIDSGIETIKRWKPAILFETRYEFEAAYKRPIFGPIFDLLKPYGYSLWNYSTKAGLYGVGIKELGTDTLAIVL